MANKINYTGSSKILQRICDAINDIIDIIGTAFLHSTTGTLVASSWTGESAPYQYDLGETYANKKILIGYDADSESASAEVFEATVNAKIVGGEGTILYAYGDIPEVDIPIIIMYE